MRLKRAAAALWRRWRRRRFATLADGTRLALRPLRPRDRAAYLAAFARLSAESRRQRFHEAKPALSAAELDYLLGADQERHVAWCALAHGRGVGVARYVRDGDRAEFAIAVIDEWQGRGVGLALARALIEVAAAQGVRRLTAEALADNRAVARLAARLGAATVPRDGRLALELDLRTNRVAGATWAAPSSPS